MSAKAVDKPAQFQVASPSKTQLEVLRALSFLASFCPLHKAWTAARLQSVFAPAVQHSFVRIFNNKSGTPCAALLWARLSDPISVQMKCGTYHLRPNDWNSGDNLWFVDLIAPFGHGKDVARFVIKNPPPEQFQLARVGSSGGIERVISGDASRQRGTRMKTSFPNREWVDL
jgi:cytolysin-activating lysine-acyltransferase